MLPITEAIRVKTVQVECIAPPGRPSYYANGVPQVAGDRARFPLGDAIGLVAARKAEIIDGSERIVSEGFAPPDPPRHWNATKW